MQTNDTHLHQENLKYSTTSVMLFSYSVHFGHGQRKRSEWEFSRKT